MARIREVVILRVRAKTKSIRAMIDLMVESISDAIAELEPNWQVSVGVREKQVSGDDVNFVRIVVLFLTTTCDSVYLVNKINCLGRRGIYTYVISMMPRESQEFRLVEKQDSVAGIVEYHLSDSSHFVGELRGLFRSVYN